MTLKLIPGYQFSEREKIDLVKLNQLGRPTIDLQGTLSSASIAAGSITADKLSPTLISELPHALPERRDLVMIQDVSANGLAESTVGEILDLGVPGLPIIAEVTLNDFAWIIQAGANRQAKIADFLRQAINGQDPLAAPADVNPDADTLLVYDDSAPSGNRNRKGTVTTVVTSVTNTLIEDAPALAGEPESAALEILVRDTTAPAGAQHKRAPLATVVRTAIRSWGSFKADGTILSPLCSFNSANDIVTTNAPHSLQSGDWIWFESSNSGNGVTASTAYYVARLTTTTLQLYKNRPGAMAQDPAQRVKLTADVTNRRFSQWEANPLKARDNLSAVLRINTEDGTASIGRFRVCFETPLQDAQYAIQATCGTKANSGAIICAVHTFSLPQVGYFDIRTYDDDGETAQPEYVSILVIR